jgi:5-methylcytosine-specific restriction enzyme A
MMSGLIGGAAEMDEEAKRNRAWNRDELIVALDFYVRFNGNPPSKRSAEIKALSALLNDLSQQDGKSTEKFRNVNGVYMKLMNFRRFDPAYAKRGAVGLSHGGKGVEIVWNDFHNRTAALTAAAEAIKANISHEPNEHAAANADYEIAEAEEGTLLTRVHLQRERNREIVKRKKAEVLKRTGSLECEACSFEFKTKYGERGDGFAEVHHTKPLYTLTPGTKTKLEDLAIVCSNCHRMIHAKQPWLSIGELKKIIN